MTKLLSVRETLERLPISRWTLEREVKRGRLHKVKLASRTFYRESEIESYIASERVA